MEKKTIVYKGVEHGDWVDCLSCGRRMLLPCGADQCPECCSEGSLLCADGKQEADADDLGEVERSEKALKPYEYLEADTFEQLYPEEYRKMKDDGDIRCCEVCGEPMSHGYYCDGNFYCSEDCLLQSYTKEEVETMMYQLEDGEKLEDLDDEEKEARFEAQDVCYYTDWDNAYNM